MFSSGFTSVSVLVLFLLSVTFFVFVHGFYSISSNIDETLSINTSANVFGDFNIHYKDWLTYSGVTDRSRKLCYKFHPTAILRGLTFLLRSQTVILMVRIFWVCFFLLMLLFVLQWLSFHWEILIMLLYQVPLIFHQIYNRMPRFIA